MFLTRQAVTGDGKKVVPLFLKNYPDGYYETHFSEAARLDELLAKKSYYGILAKDTDTGDVVGFSGAKIEVTRPGYRRVYLCHLLVDEYYRGKGVGRLLDEAMEAFLSAGDALTVAYGLVIPRTVASLQSKTNKGYGIWGIRNFYGEKEPSPVGEGHLFTVGKIYGASVHIELPPLHPLTKALVEELPLEIAYTTPGTIDGYTAVWPTEVRYGQYGLDIVAAGEGCEGAPAIEDIIEEMAPLKAEHPYLSVKVNCSLRDYSRIEQALIERRWFPTSLLPFFDGGRHMIDFQYIDAEKVHRISKELPNYSEIYSFE